MSKTWYYEVMGSAIGPISSAELKRRAQLGQIQPDTPVRLGPEGKWQPADRVKGLFDPPPPPPPAAAPVPASAATLPFVPAANSPQKSTVAVEPTLSLAPVESSTEDPDERLPHEYDFFRLVGFEQAIGTRLHQVLVDYCREHQLTLTEVTKRALATFLGRKDLLETPREGASESAETGHESPPDA